MIVERVMIASFSKPLLLLLLVQMGVASQSYTLNLAVMTGQTVAGKTITSFANCVMRNIAVGDPSVVAFTASFSGGNGVFTPTNVLAKTNDMAGGRTLNALSCPAMSNSGVTAFTSNFAGLGGGEGVFTISPGGGLVKAFDVAQPIGSLSLNSILNVAVNDSGTPVFWGAFSGGNGIFTPTSSLIQTGQTIGGQTVQSIAINSAPALNNNGTAVVLAGLSGGLALVTQNAVVAQVGQTTGGKTLTDLNSNTQPSINSSGTVVFGAGYTGGSGIFTQTGLLVQSGQTIGGKVIGSSSIPVINNSGAVAFLAVCTPCSGGAGVFTASDFVLAEGQTVGGKLISVLKSIALNDVGQIAIRAMFSDSTEGIILAAPVNSSVDVVSVNPKNGGASPQTFTVTYSGPLGVSDLNSVYFILNSSLSVAHGCAMLYVPSTNGLYLYNDAGNGFVTGSISPGSPGTLANSQCTISNAGSAVTFAGVNLTLPVAVTFTAAFSGSKNMYALAASNSGVYSNWVNEGTWTAAASQPPSLVSVLPINSTGLTHSFNVTFSESNGVSDLNSMYVLFNPTLSTSHACLLLYLPVSNALYLYNDAGSGFVSGSISPGSAGTLGNSQCTVGNAGPPAVSGTNLTLPMSIAFTSNFSGIKNVYAFAGNFEGMYSGVAAVGTWTPAPSQAPAVVSVTPINGTGSPATFSTTVSEPNGVSDLSQAYLLINSSLSAVNGCVLVYFPLSNSVYLYNDTGSGFVTGTIGPGSAGTLTNSQCTLSNAGATTVAGTNLTLPVSIAFAAGFAGTKNVYAFAANNEGAGSGWQPMGAWTPH